MSFLIDRDAIRARNRRYKADQKSREAKLDRPVTPARMDRAVLDAIKLILAQGDPGGAVRAVLRVAAKGFAYPPQALLRLRERYGEDWPLKVLPDDAAED